MHPYDQIEVIHPSGQIEFYDLDPAKGILNIGHHPDNDVVLQGSGVHSFHALLDHRQGPYQVLFLNEAGAGTTAQEFTLWQTVRIGEYELVLMGQSQQSATDKIDSRTPQFTHPSQERPRQQVPEDETGWRIEPGKVLTSALTIHNRGGRAATFQIYTEGIDPNWVSFSQQEVNLAADERVQVQMQIAPPRQAETEAGIHTFSWIAISPDYPGWQQSESVRIVVEPFHHVAWGSLTPASVQSAAFRRSGSSLLSITNMGNQPVDYLLWGKDLRDECRLQFEAGGAKSRTQAGQSQEKLLVHLAPGERLPVTITLTPIEGRLIGVNARRSRFAVYGGFPDEKQAAHSVTGTFESYPLINLGLVLVIALALVLASLFIYREQVGRWVDDLLLAPVGARPVLAAAIEDQGAGGATSSISRFGLFAEQGVGGVSNDSSEISLEEIFKEAGRRYNIDWRILASLSYRESRLNPRALGGSGEYGLMQIMPNTWNEWAPLVEVQNPWDPYSNVMVGAAYLSYLRGYFRDLGYADYRWALAAYNLGPNRVLQVLDGRGHWQEIPLTQRQYVADILMGVESAPGWVSAAEQKPR
jgi:hypothetical protein